MFENISVLRFVTMNIPQALDESVKIATRFNVKPIPGTTIVFCNVSDSMRTPCSSAKGLGKPRFEKYLKT